MKLYKQISIVENLVPGIDGIEVTSDDGSMFLSNGNFTVAKDLLTKGRIVCTLSDQSSMGKFYFVYVKLISKDYSKDGWVNKNIQYRMNDRVCLEDLPGFILLWSR